MRFPFLVALVFFIIIGTGYWYQTTAYQCPVPLSYRVGVLHESFGLTTEEAQDEIAAAVSVWEEAAGRDLFVYDDAAAFTVNFVFDERQEQSNGERSERQALDEKQKENTALFATIDSVQQEFETLSQNYRTQVAVYETRLSEYNTQVRQYNDRGGAPEEVFAALEEERTALNRESTRLNGVANELNILGTRLNQLGERGNALVRDYNRAVSIYNERYGHAHEFTQGDYRGDRINIYEFSNRNELKTVLVHEFGHALGIDHIDDASAVMYYLLEDTESAPRLAESDMTAFAAVCGTGTEWDHSLRRSIRTILSYLN